jgi:hypothetical protein
VPTLTVTLNDNNGNSNSWSYVNSNNSSATGNFTVTQTDPAGNQTVYNFAGEYQTQMTSYQGGCPTSISGCKGSGTLLKTVATCYGSGGATPPAPPNCQVPSVFPSVPFTETDVYTSLNRPPITECRQSSIPLMGIPLRSQPSILAQPAQPTKPIYTTGKLGMGLLATHIPLAPSSITLPVTHTPLIVRITLLIWRKQPIVIPAIPLPSRDTLRECRHSPPPRHTTPTAQLRLLRV